MKVKVIFVSKGKCWKLIVDLEKCNLIEILMCLEEQFEI